MPRYPQKKSDTLGIIAKSEDEKELLRFFKSVCIRDGYEIREEFFKLVREQWAPRHNFPLGNPQHQIIEYKEVLARKFVCEVCGERASFKADTVFPINPTKFLCRSHLNQFERRGEILSKEVVR